MVVVFGHKVEMIYQSHRNLQPRMQRSPSEKGRLDSFQAPDQVHSRRTKLGQDRFHLAGIVFRLVGLSIGQVRRGQRFYSRQIIFNPRQPEGLTIEQVARVFLD